MSKLRIYDCATDWSKSASSLREVPTILRFKYRITLTPRRPICRARQLDMFSGSQGRVAEEAPKSARQNKLISSYSKKIFLNSRIIIFF